MKKQFFDIEKDGFYGTYSKMGMSTAGMAGSGNIDPLMERRAASVCAACV